MRPGKKQRDAGVAQFFDFFETYSEHVCLLFLKYLRVRRRARAGRSGRRTTRCYPRTRRRRSPGRRPTSWFVRRTRAAGRRRLASAFTLNSSFFLQFFDFFETYFSQVFFDLRSTTIPRRCPAQSLSRPRDAVVALFVIPARRVRVVVRGGARDRDLLALGAVRADGAAEVERLARGGPGRDDARRAAEVAAAGERAALVAVLVEQPDVVVAAPLERDVGVGVDGERLRVRVELGVPIFLS